MRNQTAKIIRRYIYERYYKMGDPNVNLRQMYKKIKKEYMRLSAKAKRKAKRQTIAFIKGDL
jgi:hypothetical protein